MTRSGAKIRQLRKQKKWTIKELGDRADIDRSAMTNIENGAALGRERAERIARALGVSLETIWSPREDAASRRDLDVRLRSLEAQQGEILEGLRAVLETLAERGIQVRLHPRVAESLATARHGTPKR